MLDDDSDPVTNTTSISLSIASFANCFAINDFPANKLEINDGHHGISGK